MNPRETDPVTTFRDALLVWVTVLGEAAVVDPAVEYPDDPEVPEADADEVALDAVVTALTAGQVRL
jgi:hypothetical protein